MESILRHTFLRPPPKWHIYHICVSITFRNDHESEQFAPGVRESARHKPFVLLKFLPLSLRTRPPQSSVTHMGTISPI